MRIAIIGAGHLGYIIAEFLSNEQYDVVVVDSDESKLDGDPRRAGRTDDPCRRHEPVFHA